MALRENILAAGLPDLTAAKPGKADASVSHGVLRTSCFVASILNGDSIGSTFIVARLPSHARVLRQSEIHSSGIAGMTDTDLGVAEAPACLMDGQTLAATGTVKAASAIPVGQEAKTLWELAGLASDPKREMDVVLTMKTASTAAGTVAVDLVYVTE
jgi:hypothetical protein